MSSNNPLQQYFRQPAIYIKLPSAGQFYPPGTLNMTDTGELPVLPMTAIDEITYRTPDALFNGQATVNVIESCLPNIVNGWAVPAMDVDAILIAIRIASYGHEMELTSTCPACRHESDYGIDLRVFLDKIQCRGTVCRASGSEGGDVGGDAYSGALMAISATLFR